MSTERCGYVYILASKRNGTLYIGVTSDLVKRVWQHRTGESGGFAARYGVKGLVYFETHADIANAITREKAMKKWRRAWKIALVEANNPNWCDLFDEIAGSPPSRG
ncbi:MAG: GIY-YIG nuclease family protein [Alphaproteobacteria bacterium]|nr:GIY-YIG nuclease family protein [Alphaproteobacteria bacterium]